MQQRLFLWTPQYPRAYRKDRYCWGGYAEMATRLMWQQLRRCGVTAGDVSVSRNSDCFNQSRSMVRGAWSLETSVKPVQDGEHKTDSVCIEIILNLLTSITHCSYTRTVPLL